MYSEFTFMWTNLPWNFKWISKPPESPLSISVQPPLGGRQIPFQKSAQIWGTDKFSSCITRLQWKLLPISCKPLCTYYNGMLEVGWNFGKRPKCNRTLAKALKKASKCSSEPLNWHQYEDKMKVHSKASSGQPESFLMTTFFFFSHVVISKWPTLRDVLYASTHKYNNVFVYLVSVSNKWTLIPPQRVPLAHFILTSR